ncbi:hypothetical protein BABINDRAFT_121907 [Babjeviella inositovora NRRL Y-12698]|uniref:Protein BIG1 n=1 Tax=Babjeviella inositovora NRRL Y-12698 TaxID=984486 RepID=A0A1E3QUB4_9ASCO|nr:uncharacterized protein BABINDRAFT_121907 [Babjeviella inositovora NRRL Y-12698]ODQ81260.1 hypothetical protein BABINDRAFT_121907 [Babjeviella inositovora NRRL Y-12698]
MKFTSLAVTAALLSSCQAFADTAPFLLRSQNPSSQLPYFTEEQTVADLVSRLSEEVCGQSDSPLMVVRIPGLKKYDFNTVTYLSNLVKDANTVYSPNVHYTSADAFPLSDACAVSRISVDSLDFQYFAELFDTAAQVIVVDLPAFTAGELQQVDDNLAQLDFFVKTLYKIAPNVVIQGLPTFAAPLKRELDQDWEETEGVAIRAQNSTFVIKNPNLFTHYQFFTPGVWMSTIVSLLLVGILYVALSWVSNLKISYRAFDKPLDFDKKAN